MKFVTPKQLKEHSTVHQEGFKDATTEQEEDQEHDSNFCSPEPGRLIENQID